MKIWWGFPHSCFMCHCKHFSRSRGLDKELEIHCEEAFLSVMMELSCLKACQSPGVQWVSCCVCPLACPTILEHSWSLYLHLISHFRTIWASVINIKQNHLNVTISLHSEVIDLKSTSVRRLVFLVDHLATQANFPADQHAKAFWQHKHIVVLSICHVWLDNFELLLLSEQFTSQRSYQLQAWYSSSPELLTSEAGERQTDQIKWRNVGKH